MVERTISSDEHRELGRAAGRQQAQEYQGGFNMTQFMSTQALLLFFGTGLIFSLTPGPAVLQVTAQAFRGGFGAAMEAVLGTMAGGALYIAISALGVGALIAASATAFAIIKWLGAAYLILMGVYAIWRAQEAHTEVRKPGGPFRQAFLTQLGNPKAVLFFGAFMPQFLDRHKMLLPQYAEMFVIVMLWEGLVLGLYGWLASHGAKLKAAGSALWRERISGAVFILIGIIFAFAQR
jgi:homoserine/homoserine lactone efflux protein